MIDIENYIVDAVQAAYTSAQKSVTVIGKYIEAPNSFPCVMIYQLSNITYKPSLDGELRERHARISFQVDVYSNKTEGAKAEVKELLGILDDTMQDLKFTRESFNFIPSTSALVTRLTARYSAIVQKGTTNGQTITHQIYRS